MMLAVEWRLLLPVYLRGVTPDRMGNYGEEKQRAFTTDANSVNLLRINFWCR